MTDQTLGRVLPVAAMAAVAYAGSAAAGSYTGFSGDVGSATLHGTAFLDTTFNELQLVGEINSQQGAIQLPDLDPGQAVQSFSLTFRVRQTGGTLPADGFSLAFGDMTGVGSFGEMGPAGFDGLVVGFDTYDQGGGAGFNEGIHVWVDGTLIDTNTSIDPFTYNGSFDGSEWNDVNISYDSVNGLTVSYGDNPSATAVFTNLDLGAYAPEVGDQFGVGARTGGLVQSVRLADVSFQTTVPEPASLAVFALAPLLMRRRRQA